MILFAGSSRKLARAIRTIKKARMVGKQLSMEQGRLIYGLVSMENQIRPRPAA